MISGALHSAFQESRGSLKVTAGCSHGPLSILEPHSMAQFFLQPELRGNPARAAAIRHILSLGRYGYHLAGRLSPESLCPTLHGRSFPSPSLRVWDPCVWGQFTLPRGRSIAATIPWALQPNTGFRATPPFHNSPLLPVSMLFLQWSLDKICPISYTFFVFFFQAECTVF